MFRIFIQQINFTKKYQTLAFKTLQNIQREDFQIFTIHNERQLVKLRNLQNEINKNLILTSGKHNFQQMNAFLSIFF